MNAKRIARPLVACIALMIGLVGCGGSTDPAGSAAPGPSQSLDASATPAQRAVALYQEAVSHPQSYFDLPEHPEGAGGSDVPTFDYALVAVKPGELPALPISPSILRVRVDLMFRHSTTLWWPSSPASSPRCFCALWVRMGDGPTQWRSCPLL